MNFLCWTRARVMHVERKSYFIYIYLQKGKEWFGNFIPCSPQKGMHALRAFEIVQRFLSGSTASIEEDHRRQSACRDIYLYVFFFLLLCVCVPKRIVCGIWSMKLSRKLDDRLDRLREIR